MKKWQVYVDHETIIYDIDAETKEEAEKKAMELNGRYKEVEVCSVDAMEAQNDSR